MDAVKTRASTTKITKVTKKTLLVGLLFPVSVFLCCSRLRRAICANIIALVRFHKVA